MSNFIRVVTKGDTLELYFPECETPIVRSFEQVEELIKELDKYVDIIPKPSGRCTVEPHRIRHVTGCVFIGSADSQTFPESGNGLA